MSKVKVCENCAYCPDWERVTEYSGIVERGRCRFPTKNKDIRRLRLPLGVDIQTPWVYRDHQKHNCPGHKEL